MRMKEYLTALLHPFLDDIQVLEVTESVDEQGVLLTVLVARKDMGRIIGKAGQTINAIRTIVHAVGAKQQKNVSVKCLEPKI